jgi:hypothetical protein
MAVCGEALDWCFAAINSFGPCDKSRVAALKFQGVIHVVSFTLAIFAILGLAQSGLSSFPWAQYKVNATAVVEVTNASMLPFLPAQAEFDVHINVRPRTLSLEPTPNVFHGYEHHSPRE